MTKNKFLALLTIIILGTGCTMLTGCQGNSTSSPTEVDSSVQPQITDQTVGFQLETPKVGEEIAIIKTNMGDIKVRFFSEISPKAVENFKTHAKNGYYNGHIFHRVINNFMIQGGDPTGTGTGGNSIWGKPFEDEFSEQLLNLRGSVSMANSGKNTNGSQFFINQCKKCPSTTQLPEQVRKLYNEHGGNPHLDGAFSKNGSGHTVFAQVFEGMDIVDKIASVKVNSQNKPLKDVKIEKIDFSNYQ